MTPIALTRYLSSECSELVEELSRPTPRPSSLKSEVGDVLFDALMLNLACERAYGWKMEDAAQAACDKVSNLQVDKVK